MRVTIICGLLGSGKTTFLNNLLKKKGPDTVVLVNEFGDVGIDGQLLSSSGRDVVELPSGCVCCTLKADLVTTINEIVRQYNPKEIIIEPSGIASPSGILEIFGSEGLPAFKLSPVIGIIDATSFIEDHQSDIYGHFFYDQITNSDILIINKCDLVTEEEPLRISAVLKGLNPAAIILVSVKGEADLPEDVERGVFKPAHSHLEFESFAWRRQGRISRENVTSLFHGIASGKFGRIIRSKGIFNLQDSCMRIDYASGIITEEPLSYEGPNRFIAIGTGLDKEGIEQFLIMLYSKVVQSGALGSSIMFGRKDFCK